MDFGICYLQVHFHRFAFSITMFLHLKYLIMCSANPNALLGRKFNDEINYRSGKYRSGKCFLCGSLARLKFVKCGLCAAAKYEYE